MLANMHMVLIREKIFLTNNDQIGGASVSYPKQWWPATEKIPIVGRYSGWFNFVIVIVIVILFRSHFVIVSGVKMLQLLCL